MKVIKAAAVLSSIVLVGGYVLLQTGGGLFPSSKSGRISRMQVDDEPATKPASTRPRLMPGSKSAHAFESDDNVIFGDAAPTTEPATRPVSQQ